MTLHTESVGSMLSSRFRYQGRQDVSFRVQRHNYSASSVFILGVVIMVLGRYLVLGYLDPLGLPSTVPWPFWVCDVVVGVFLLAVTKDPMSLQAAFRAL